MRSSTVPRRPSLILSRTERMKSGSSKKGFVIGVAMNVGAMVLDRMRCDARSSAKDLFMPSIAHLDAQYSERDRKSVVGGKSVAVSVELGDRRNRQKKKQEAE